MLDPGRDRWQRPTRVLRALRARPNAVVADIGAGPGYFTLRLARAVGPRGHVYAVDPEPRSLERLRQRLELRLVDGSIGRLASRGGALVVEPPADLRAVLRSDPIERRL